MITLRRPYLGVGCSFWGWSAICNFFSWTWRHYNDAVFLSLLLEIVLEIALVRKWNFYNFNEKFHQGTGKPSILRRITQRRVICQFDPTYADWRRPRRREQSCRKYIVFHAFLFFPTFCSISALLDTTLFVKPLQFLLN